MFYYMQSMVVDENLKTKVAPKYRPITSEYLDYDEVMDAMTK